jgi:hypothetical protein
MDLPGDITLQAADGFTAGLPSVMRRLSDVPAALASTSRGEHVPVTQAMGQQGSVVASAGSDLQHPVPVVVIEVIPRLCDDFRTWAMIRV